MYTERARPSVRDTSWSDPVVVYRAPGARMIWQVARGGQAGKPLIRLSLYDPMDDRHVATLIMRPAEIPGIVSLLQAVQS